MLQATTTPPPKKSTAERVGEDVQTAAGAAAAAAGVIVAATGGSAKPCPPFTWRNLPQFDRTQIPAWLFAPACPPGQGTADTCYTPFWSVVVPWPQFVSEGWTAPGGNRYWSNIIDAYTGNPIVAGMFKLMKDASKTHFVNKYRGSSKAMRQVMLDERASMTTEFGKVKLDIMPNPDETAKDFIKRGGYLLWIGPKSAFGGSSGWLEHYTQRAKWWPKSLAAAELWGSYVPSTNKVGYTIRVIYNSGTWNDIVNFVGTPASWIVKGLNKVCDGLTEPEVQTAAAMATTIPAAAPYAISVTTVASICGMSLDPPCTPTSPQLPKSAYPDGSIAWYNQDRHGYEIAVPFKGNGFTHQVTAIVGVAPIGVPLVDKATWQKSTLPWYKRTMNEIILAAAGAVTLVGLTAAMAATKKKR